MKLVVQICLDSDAFKVGQQGELTKMFNQVLAAMPMFPRDEARVLRDTNGNGVGAFEVIEDECSECGVGPEGPDLAGNQGHRFDCSRHPDYALIQERLKS